MTNVEILTVSDVVTDNGMQAVFIIHSTQNDVISTETLKCDATSTKFRGAISAQRADILQLGQLPVTKLPSFIF